MYLSKPFQFAQQHCNIVQAASSPWMASTGNAHIMGDYATRKQAMPLFSVKWSYLICTCEFHSVPQIFVNCGRGNFHKLNCSKVCITDSKTTERRSILHSTQSNSCCWKKIVEKASCNTKCKHRNIKLYALETDIPSWQFWNLHDKRLTVTFISTLSNYLSHKWL